MTGYGGTYRAVVVDDIDPLQQYRLGVVVPEVYGEGVSVWAVALSAGSSMPIIGDLMWVSFEHGDTDYPIWQLASGADDHTATGAYRAGSVLADTGFASRAMGYAWRMLTILLIVLIVLLLTGGGLGLSRRRR